MTDLLWDKVETMIPKILRLLIYVVSFELITLVQRLRSSRKDRTP